MRQLTLSLALTAALVLITVSEVLSHPHPHPHAHSTEEDDHVPSDRRQRKRSEHLRRGGVSGELTERQLRKLRRQNQAERALHELGADDHEEVDPESLVTMPLPSQPVYYEMDKELDSRERRNRHVMMKRRMQLRLFQIQQKILTDLGLPYQPIINMSKGEQENVRDFYEPIIKSGKPLGELTEKQNLYALMANCQGPRNAHKETWADAGMDMRLYFPVNSTARKFHRTFVHSAVLRLYKPGDGDIELWQDADNDTNTEMPELTTQMQDADDDADHDADMDAEDDDDADTEPEDLLEDELAVDLNLTDAYTVTVYQYTRALRKNKKEKLEEVASILVSKNHTGWVRIPIKDTAHHWMTTPKKNFGLKIVVVDADGQRQDIADIFHVTNCSEDANSTMDMKYALAGAFDFEDNRTAIDQKATYPTLDLITITEDEEDELHPASLSPGRVIRRRVQRSAGRSRDSGNVLSSGVNQQLLRHRSSSSSRVPDRKVVFRRKSEKM